MKIWDGQSFSFEGVDGGISGLGGKGVQRISLLKFKSCASPFWGVIKSSQRAEF